MSNEYSHDQNISVPPYNQKNRDHMRQLLQTAPPLIDLIASGRVPFGTQNSADSIDHLAGIIEYQPDGDMDEDAAHELTDDRYVLINMYGAIKKEPGFWPLYVQAGKVLRKYGLFDEEVTLLEKALAEGSFKEADLISAQDRLSKALQLREADDACLSDSERIALQIRRALQKKPADEERIKDLLDQCTDDNVLYDIARRPDKESYMYSIRNKAALMIRSRDYQYALSSHIMAPFRTSMILNLFDSLEGDDLFIARTILTDPDYRNKQHMLLYCKDEALIMLGWRYVYGARMTCADRLRAMESRFPEAYEEMTPEERSCCEADWLSHAAEIARTDLLPEDEAVRGRLSGTASVDSEPLDLFISIHHPRRAVRWWHARKLEHPVHIAYVGSWTSDDEIKEKLSVKINSTELITEMIFGDLSAIDMVFAFPKPKDLTLQDRFCVEIMKNHPDRNIREHVRKELIRGEVSIPGVDLSPQ